LQYLLDDWVVPLCRRGNLSVALGSRGKGNACAHYEPGLRVVNLTKQYGDGSLAHEFAHFLDHMLAIHAVEGESRFLSARLNRQQSPDGPIAMAMTGVLRSVTWVRRRETVVGAVEPRRCGASLLRAPTHERIGWTGGIEHLVSSRLPVFVRGFAASNQRRSRAAG
jgi:hypothetical protein